MADDEFTLEMENIDELSDKLKALGETTRRRYLKNALAEGSLVMRDAVEDAAPERTDTWTEGSDSLPPGALKSDIDVGLQMTDEGGHAFIGPGPKTGYVARFVEFGHRLVTGSRAHKQRDQKVVGHVPAHPFMRPAADAAAQATLDRFAEQLTEDLERD